MKKPILFAFFSLFYLISTYSLAANFLNDLPKGELKKYNSLKPEAQAEALRALEVMGNYDPEHTRLDNTGHFYFVEDSLEKIIKDYGIKLPSETSRQEKNLVSDNPPTGITKDLVPILHSFPGSPNVIYLNFIGANITGTAWNSNYKSSIFLARPFSLQPFKSEDMQKIIQIWARVTEDYAPWQVDVTTEPPTTFTTTTVTALITKSTTFDGKPMPSNTSAGIAYLDIFNYILAQYYSPALIYSDRLGNNTETIAEAISHEIGHNFGLSHEGTSTTSYWGGAGNLGSGISWGCIMGAAYYRDVSKFCNGRYPDANNKEDQLAIIGARVPLRSSSAGTLVETATLLPIVNNAFNFSGIIESFQISNFFLLKNIEGTIKINATTFRAKSGRSIGNNLCLGFQLYTSSLYPVSESSNPNSCSISQTINLPKSGDYLLRILPVANPTTPIPLYGSIGQYDLSGSVLVSNVLTIKPPFTTLALNTKMTFDAYDTVRVTNGVPPYKFTSTLNPFSQSGTTYTYTASKPGLDTIGVTDSSGATGSTQVTVSYMDFGGMYGYSKAGSYNNPLTGAFKCPTGYQSQTIMGAIYDNALYYCYRIRANGIPADFDFGGIYSYSASGVRINPYTGAATCPNGYSSAQVYGESSNSPDYPAFICYKKHVDSVAEVAPFAGMYAPSSGTGYNNPVTGGLSCPAGTKATMMLGTLLPDGRTLDYPFYFCSTFSGLTQNPSKLMVF